MKSMLRFFIHVLTLTLVFQTNISAQGFMSEDIIGNIIAKSQPVFVYRDGKELNIGSFEVNLKKGDIVATKEGGKALISLKNGSNIAIAPSTRIELTEEMIEAKNTTIRSIIHLIYGKIRAKIQQTRKR
ncbi:FecR domain-containing protein, partial [bacterium]|nr:FecR domain-containing protein [bacterium]